MAIPGKEKIISIDSSLEIEKCCEKFEKVIYDFDFEDLAERQSMTFALCILTQRILSVFAEILICDKKLRKLAKALVKAEDEYMPSGPPLSPLTPSYYQYWSLYDAKQGNQETLARFLLSNVHKIGLPQELIDAIETFVCSRMGIYEHIGFEDGLIILKELVTDQEIPVICPAGHNGSKGELWFSRVFPALPPDNASVAGTTPYVLRNSKKDWVEFYERQGILKGSLGVNEKLHDFMKYGPSFNYWNEFIFLSYTNHAFSWISLTGIPDIKGTKPHENLDVSSKRGNGNFERRKS